MKDILSKYKKHRLISNIWIVTASLIMAIWINFFVIDSTEFWNNLKTSVLNANSNTNLADIYLEKTNNDIILKTSKDINNSTSLSFSISYNPTEINIADIVADNAQVLNLSNTPGINSVVITFDTEKDIIAWNKIITLNVEKLKDGIQNINIINAKFTDWNSEDYLLTTSWISF